MCDNLTQMVLEAFYDAQSTACPLDSEWSVVVG